MSKLVEAAAAEAFKWIGLAANVHWTDPHVDEGRKNIWRSAMRKALLAFLEAALGDEGVMIALTKSAMGHGAHPALRSPVPMTSDVDAMKAALRALIQQVKS